MLGNAWFKFTPQRFRHGGAGPRRRRNRTILTAVFGSVGCILLIAGAAVAWKYQRPILRMLHRAPLPPPVAEPVAEFSPFKTLDDFTGVECIYTAKFVEPLPVVRESAVLNLMPMSRVVVQEIHRDSGDFDHPNSAGYKVYARTQKATALQSLDNPSAAPVQVLDTLVVLYPVMGNHDEVIELHLCPVKAYKKAQQLWLDRSFKYVGNQLGGLDIDPGTIVTVTEVVPGQFGTSGVSFDLAFRLPTGETVHQAINPGNMGLLQPAE